MGYFCSRHCIYEDDEGLLGGGSFQDGCIWNCFNSSSLSCLFTGEEEEEHSVLLSADCFNEGSGG